MKYLFSLVLTLVIYSAYSYAQERQALRADINSEYDNGYQEERFEHVLQVFQSLYRPLIESKGGTLLIKKDWQDGAVNAFAWRNWNEYHMEILGGASRYYLVSEDAFILLICHEMGHLLGGKPGSFQISLEGQADYFSSAKCTRLMYQQIPHWDNPQVADPAQEEIATAKAKCQQSFSPQAKQELCQRSLLAGLSLAKLWAKIDASAAVSLLKRDSGQVTRTLDVHPKAQCRLDTYVAGALCPVSVLEEFSFEDEKLGACHMERFSTFARPGCWFRESL